jgi:hypothetical protein
VRYTGAWAEEAEGIGVDGLGDAVVFKGGAEVAEVVPGGVGGDETARDVEAGMVIDGEEEDLLLRSRPPLVDGGWSCRAAKARRCEPCENGGKCECVEAEPGAEEEGAF